MRWRASSVAWLSSRLNKAGEMSARRVMAWVSSLSPLARIASIDMPVFEKRAPELTATLVTTSRSPRSTSTSVTTGLSCLRSAILLRCDWPLLSAISTRFWSVSRGDCASTGPATVMSSSAGEAADDVGWSIGDRRDVPAQLDPRAAFDMVDQADDDVVEHRGYFLGDPVAAGQKQVGDVLQYRVVAFGRIAFEREFELVNNLQSLRHF